MERKTSIVLAALTASMCVGSLSESVLAGPPAPVPQTGQTQSYGRRDDGALRKGVAWPKPRFILRVNRAEDTGLGGGRAGNGICDGRETCNGAVLDRLTGLTWLQNADCFGLQHWKTALSSANQLASGHCGLSDGSRQGAWRLPNVRELQSLFDINCFGPALSDRLGTGCYSSDPAPVFSNVEFGLYWSSSTSAQSANFVWTVDPFYGGDFGDTSGSDRFVWPVRGRLGQN